MKMADHPFTLTLLKWFAANGRELPWRQTKDPYPIYLSEIIMQQTRISQGLDYWHHFMAKYPRIEDLAAADEDDVLRSWQGLGYYSRARNMHTAARQIVKAGGFPTTYEGIRQLKGVGDYTAAAIASFAFDMPTAVVDGNVYRVLARHFGIDSPIDTTKGKRIFAELAQELLPEGKSADYNQAIMDFGALICTPSAPHCTTCPLVESCEAHRQGKTTLWPVKSKKTKVSERHLIYIYIRSKGKTAFRKRPSGDIWQGLWEPLLVENSQLPPIAGTWHQVAHAVRHVLTHRVIYADLYLVETDTHPNLPPGYLWVPEDELDKLGKSRLVEILLGLLEDFVPQPEHNDGSQDGHHQ